MTLVMDAAVLLVASYCAGALRDTVSVDEDDASAGTKRIITFGQNVWGNLAVGSTEACNVTTASGKAEEACPPTFVDGTFEDPVVALGATWTNVVAGGKLYSAGWAGDGGCGFSPNVQTRGMKGEHVHQLLDASTRWGLDLSGPSGLDTRWGVKPSQPSDLDLYANAFKGEIEGCEGAELRLSSASAAYTSSLLLSNDGLCVFTFGLVGDGPTDGLAVPRRYQHWDRLSRPLAVFRATGGDRVLQALATYGGNFVLMESGKVRRAEGFGGKVASSKGWSAVGGLPADVARLYGNGWTYYGALTRGGDLWLWSDAYAPLPGASKAAPAPYRAMGDVAEASLGPEHMLVLKRDGDALSLWSAGSNGCGQLGRRSSEKDGLQKIEGKWRSACAGFYYSLAVDEAGKVYMWGSINANTYAGGEGACTAEGRTHASTPVPVEDFFKMQAKPWTGMPSPVDSIACGFYHAAVLVDA